MVGHAKRWVFGFLHDSLPDVLCLSVQVHFKTLKIF